MSQSRSTNNIITEQSYEDEINISHQLKYSDIDEIECHYVYMETIETNFISEDRGLDDRTWCCEITKGVSESTVIAMADGGRRAQGIKKDTSDDLRPTRCGTDNDGDHFF